jgi:hypothetical protein
MKPHDILSHNHHWEERDASRTKTFHMMVANIPGLRQQHMKPQIYLDPHFKQVHQQ